MNITVNDKSIEIDEEGFLVDPRDWSEDVGLELVKQHEAAGHKKVTETGWKRWSYYFDQLAASLRWIRVSFRLPISLVLFFFHRLHPASIFRGSNGGARRYSMPTIFRSRRVPAIRFQMH